MSEHKLLNNRYYLEETLGQGGMAVVYRGRDLTLERHVAIKILREDYSSDVDFRDRFRQEAKAVANLTHPNIVTVYDFGLQDEHLYIVMEYVPGTDLKGILKRNGRLGVNEALALTVQACSGIGHAHRAGIVHCDIKPKNLLVTPEQRLKVVDFGIARAMANILPDEKSEIVWGSPKYFSPEQASGKAPLPASDVYSLGVVLYEELTGQVPFQADSAEVMARMHREVPPPSPRKLNPLIPFYIEDFLLKVLSKEPSHRYRNAEQMGRILEGYLPSQGLLPEEPPAQNAEPEVHFYPLAASTEIEPQPVQSVTTKPSSDRYQPRTLKSSSSVRSSRKRNIAEPGQRFDWVTWVLILLTLVAVGGLIPFWLWVYYIVYPPV